MSGKRLQRFRTKAGNLYTIPRMFSTDLESAYDLKLRAEKGDPGSQFKVYDKARGMKKMGAERSFREDVSLHLLEEAVVETFGTAAKEAVRQD